MQDKSPRSENMSFLSSGGVALSFTNILSPEEQ